jgi:hypothetical protein
VRANIVEKPLSGSGTDKARRYWARRRGFSDAKLGGNVPLQNYRRQCEAASPRKWKSGLRHLSKWRAIVAADIQGNRRSSTLYVL